MSDGEPQPLPKPSKTRWVILGLLFASTVLNYLDRQTLSILATSVQTDLGMTTIDYGHVVQAFLIAYTFAYLMAGRLTDWLGGKRGLMVFVIWWSTANMLTGLVANKMQLIAARVALGLGEAGNYTAGPKVVGEHFPPAERGFAVGIYTAGAMVGATIAPPLITWLALAHSWRAAFVVTGALGLVWAVAWALLYRAPKHSFAQTAASEPATSEWSKWSVILKDRRVWGLAAARMLADPVWYFYLFWFPKYLGEARGMQLTAIAALLWLVYLAADFGSIGGGLLSGRLIKKGVAPARSRLIVMTLAACIAPLGALITGAPPLAVTFALGAVVAGAHLVFQTNISTLVVDTFDARRVATIFGFIAAGSGLGGIVSTQVIMHFASAGHYGPLFLMMALLHPLAVGVAWLVVGRQASAG